MDAPRGFLKPLSFLGLGRAEPEVPEAETEAARIKRQRAMRHNLTGTTMKLIVDSNPFTLHVKDLSASGLCGLTDAPLAVHQLVSLHLTKTDRVAVQIRWIRRALIGAAFMEAIPDDTMERLLRTYRRKH